MATHKVMRAFRRVTERIEDEGRMHGHKCNSLDIEIQYCEYAIIKENWKEFKAYLESVSNIWRAAKVLEIFNFGFGPEYYVKVKRSCWHKVWVGMCAFTNWRSHK